MGSVWSAVQNSLSLLSPVKNVRIDYAGKTTILHRLQLGDVVQRVPTVGFNLETVTNKNVTFQAWDLGGQGMSLKAYWRCYYSNPQIDSIIYVVDSTDRDRTGAAKHELFALLDEKELRRSLLLIFANKQDIPGAASETEIAQMLGVTAITSHTWSIMKSSAHTGMGISEGMDWLVEKLKDVHREFQCVVCVR